LLGQDRNNVKVEYCFVAVLITMAKRCITDVLNGDGVLTGSWVDDRLKTRPEKAAFTR
jgi:hypothetical protein